MARVNCSTKQHSRSNSSCSPSFVAILRASGDLGLPSVHAEKRLLRMLFVSQLEWRIHGVIIQAKTGRTVKVIWSSYIFNV